MSSSRAKFYEAYWRRERSAVPQDDLTTGDRKELLSLALRSFQGGSVSPGRGRVLDAGCGSGEFAEFVAELGFDVTGIDIAESAIQKAKARCPNSRFHIGSVEGNLPFDDGEFDVVWSTEVLEHLFDVHACLSEFNRVLGEKGILIITTPYHGVAKNIAIVMMAFERHFNPYLSHIRFFSKRSLKLCLSRAGFAPLSWRGIGRIWPLYKSFFVVAKKVRSPQGPPEIIG